MLLAFSSVELDLQGKNPTTLYSNILATAYDELARRIRGQPAVPEVSGNAATPIVVSGDPEGTASALSPVGASSFPDGGGTATHSPAATAFAASLAHWPIFPDTIAALAQLSALGLDLVVLSNVDRASFAHTRAALERGFTFAAVYTAEEIGSYKYGHVKFFVSL